MEVQLLPPPPAVDFITTPTSTSTTPYATAPSSPQSTIPFTWEQTPGIPKHHNISDDFQYPQHDSDFAFGYLERHSISAADELFDSGKIKPLKPPPCLHPNNDSPRSPKSPKLRFKEALSLSLSPRSKKDDFDPFSEALKQTSCEQSETHVNSRRNCKDRSSPVGLNWYNKWNLKNLLLFRSASEGSVITRKRYTKKNQSFSFRSSDDGGGGGGLTAAAEEARKKSNLQCRSGLMGCLRFHQNGGSVHEISRGIDAVMRR